MEPESFSKVEPEADDDARSWVGQRLGGFEVLSPLGAGGMGEVYLARDTKLEREVALKVLPQGFSRDPERVARFQREARLLAALNHPNIASIHGLEESEGRHFLILELVPGESLAERTARGPMPVAEALPLFRQMAEALEAAHDKGIIHRDLKPANVVVTPEGQVKLLDFGLAKAFSAESSATDLETSPTISEVGTRAGQILGTASYMSPEQARGKVLDERTDIWSYGCCLFEALTGHRVFRGETVQDTLAAVLQGEVAWEALPGSTPESVRLLLRRCLQKDRKRRLRHIADARLEIDDVLEGPTGAVSEGATAARSGWALAASAPTDRRPAYPWMALSAVLALVLGLALLRTPAEDPADKHVARTVIPLERVPQATPDNFQVAISPDGTVVAYTDEDLHLRPLDELAPRKIEGTGFTQSPFFSPDGRWAGFVSRSGGYKVPLSGGAPVALWPRGGGGNGGVTWLTDETIVFGSRGTFGGLMQIHDGDEAPQVLSQPDLARGHFIHCRPQPLPGGNDVLLTIGRAEMETWDDASIAVLKRSSGELRIVVEGGFGAVYSSTGHLVYFRGGSLLAVPFDPGEGRVQGTPVPVLEGVSADGGFALSESGTLVYAPDLAATERSRILLVDRRGEELRMLADEGEYHHVSFSPDGGRLAFMTGGATPDIRVMDLARGTQTAITSRWVNGYPRWSSDGQQVLFQSIRSGLWSGYRRRADGSGPAEHMLDTPGRLSAFWGEAGGFELWHQTRGPDMGSGVDLILRSADTRAVVRPFLATPAQEQAAALSPDGKWVVYQSNESGRFEIYLRPFPEGEGQWLVSTGGGTNARWTRDGREVVYLRGGRVMAVDVRLEGGAPVLGPPHLLFERRIDFKFGRWAFDVAPDGQSFVIVEPGPPTARADHLVLVQNFDDELKRLMIEAES